MSEEPEPMKKSKISTLIGKAKEEINGIQIIVHYSENNWETNEELNLILDEKTTIKQLIDICKQKLNNKPNIDKKKFNVMIFKKKKKIPNVEYPVCNSESQVKDYGKSHFCLVDTANKEPIKGPTVKMEEKKEEIKQENESNIKEEKKVDVINNNNTEQKDVNKDNNQNDKTKNNRTNKTKKKCVIF